MKKSVSLISKLLIISVFIIFLSDNVLADTCRFDTFNDKDCECGEKGFKLSGLYCFNGYEVHGTYEHQIKDRSCRYGQPCLFSPRGSYGIYECNKGTSCTGNPISTINYCPTGVVYDENPVQRTSRALQQLYCTKTGCSRGEYKNDGSCGNCGTQRWLCNSDADWEKYSCINPGPCSPGQKQGGCYTGEPPNTKNVGICLNGSQTCGSDCKWGGCSGQVTPQTEVCDNQDNNCNGQTDEGCIGLVYWTDLTGNKITTANVNDTVQLVAESNAASNGQTLNFNIKSTCKELTLSETIRNGIANVIWKAEYCSKNWTFNASFVSFSKISPQLSVSRTEDNAAPVVNILTPKNGEMFNLGVRPLVDFNQSSFDEDDIINWTWRFGDGFNESAQYNTTHQYLASAEGARFVKLTVSSGTGARYKTASQQIKILINGSGNDPPIAIISSPENNSQWFMDTSIQFDASLSKDDITPLNNLNFTWNFGDGTAETKTGDPLAVHKYAASEKIISKTIKLTVTDQNGLNDTDFRTISLLPINETCTGTNVPLFGCGKNYGVSPDWNWCNPLTKLMALNCTACSYCDKLFCDRASGDCIIPDCSNKDGTACNSATGCYWNSTKCITCMDLINDYSQIGLGCSLYSTGDCVKDRCGIGPLSGGKCKLSGNTCVLEQPASERTECGVACTQQVTCNKDNVYEVTCTPSNPTCCGTCLSTKGSLDGTPCGAAGIQSVMPFFSWPQLAIAILIIAAYYSFVIKSRRSKA